ncbi:MAG: rod-binding protein [Mariprofundaceae bacterium]
MRDLVETVIAQVMQQDHKHTAKAKDSDKPNAFKSQFMQKINDKSSSVAKQSDNSHPNKALWDASVQFESMLYQQMMESMRKTIPDSGLLPHGFAQGVQDSMFDQAISKAAGKNGSLGIAMSIYRQLEQNTPQQDTQHGSAKNEAIQDIRKASDIEQMSIATSLRGDINGAY